MNINIDRNAQNNTVMKLKEVIEILQSFEDQEKDVVIHYDESEDSSVENVIYDTTNEIVIIRNYD